MPNTNNARHTTCGGTTAITSQTIFPRFFWAKAYRAISQTCRKRCCTSLWAPCCYLETKLTLNRDSPFGQMIMPALSRQIHANKRGGGILGIEQQTPGSSVKPQSQLHHPL